jgi:hypothetical protein
MRSSTAAKASAWSALSIGASSVPSAPSQSIASRRKRLRVEREAGAGLARPPARLREARAGAQVPVRGDAAGHQQQAARPPAPATRSGCARGAAGVAQRQRQREVVAAGGSRRSAAGGSAAAGLRVRG